MSGKHDWMIGVIHDRRLKDAPAVLRVLLRCALVSTLSGENTFCVRQETIAKELGLPRETVSNAIRRGRDLGWLELAGERQRGRGWHQADEHRLTIPKIGEHHITYSDAEKYVTSRPEICDVAVTEPEKYVTSRPEICNEADAPTSQKGPLPGTDTGYKQELPGTGRRVRTTADCAHHANEIIDAEFTDIEDLSDVRSKAVKGSALCATPGCDQPSDVWNSIKGVEYCDSCFARLRNLR